MQGLPSIKQQYTSFKEELSSFPLLKGLTLLKNKKWQEEAQYFNTNNQENELEQFYKSWALNDKYKLLFNSSIELILKQLIAFQIKITDLKKYYQANEIFDILLKVNYKLLEIQKKKHNYKEANEYFDKAIILNFRNVDLLFKKCTNQSSEIAICLFQQKEFDQAAQVCSSIILLDPKSKDAYYFKGLCLKEQRKYFDSLQCFDILIDLDDKFQKVQLQKGLLLYALKQYEESKKYLQEAINQNQKRYRSLLLFWSLQTQSLGSCLKKQKDYHFALAYFDQVVQMQQSHVSAYIDKGDVLRKLKCFKEAVICYDMANQNLEKPSLENLILFSQQTPKGQKQQTPIPKKQLNEQEQQCSIQINFKKGLSLFALQKYEEAYQSFKLASDKEPKYLLAINYQGMSLCKQQKFKEGLECFNQLIQLVQILPLAYFLKEYFEKQSNIDVKMMKQIITSQLQDQSHELNTLLFIFNETMDKYEPNNEKIFEEIFQILKKMEKLLLS